MIDYTYDGTFEGFLTCIYEHYYREKACGIYPESSYQQDMLISSFYVSTDAEKSIKVYNAIRQKISNFDLRRIYTVFLSTVPQKENILLSYILLGFKLGKKISLMHGDPCVASVQQAEKKVTFEVHRLKGLIRFSILDGDVLYAPISPDHDVLEFLAPHFSDRYSCESFVIHDTLRSKAIISAQSQWYISEFSTDSLPKHDDSELHFQTLWKVYFDTIAIKERTNPRCQKNFMPMRYWKNLTEMKL